ncbi:hypothetical protein IFM89_034658 [Coptis chinensis]|uniref:Uncharacterized protein n=1 Tax=Coptis chinensis TaxID=261450 RepID=A0A835LU11_9MAGN|nr:hypothetical protein IFM89_034658 [Coptis chinensis]
MVTKEPCLIQEEVVTEVWSLVEEETSTEDLNLVQAKKVLDGLSEKTQELIQPIARESEQVLENIVTNISENSPPRQTHNPLHTNDILVFVNGDIRGLGKLNYILERYQNASGQFINKAKSKVFFGNFTQA